MANPILIRGGRLLDPATGRDEVADLFLMEGLIAPVPSQLPPRTEVLAASGLTVAPGLIDLHVHLREPGGEEQETIESGSRAAARGGFTTVVAMPNTSPPLDGSDLISKVRKRADEVGLVTMLPAACISRDRKGNELADLAALAAAGAAAFTDDGSTPASADLMRSAMKTARELGKPVLDHAQDPAIEKQGGVMHDGAYARRWGLPGIPAEAEVSMIRRDIELAAETGGRVHIQHVSTRAGVELIRDARARGLPVTGEATPHHLTLCDEDVRPDNPNFKMNPPLRTGRDRAAIRRGIADGVLTVLATDHAPHTADAKARGFREAPFGIVGLETAVGITYTTLVSTGLMRPADWLKRWTQGPAQVLGLPPPGLAAGARADLSLLDLESEWTVEPGGFLSRSRNTPFAGWRLVGRSVCTIRAGRITWREPAGR
ncbi:MAG: dihydroorotase [Kiritimatiellae bacterium]|nr:dihydroorotase [Kiritimatiellia bacterium]